MVSSVDLLRGDHPSHAYVENNTLLIKGALYTYLPLTYYMASLCDSPLLSSSTFRRVTVSADTFWIMFKTLSGGQVLFVALLSF